MCGTGTVMEVLAEPGWVIEYMHARVTFGKEQLMKACVVDCLKYKQFVTN
jgi:hypothetical protein